MNENWQEILQNESIDLTPRPEFRGQLRQGLVEEWNGRPMVSLGAVEEPGAGRRRRRLLATAAATVALVTGLVIASRPSGDSTVLVPASTPEPPPATAPAPPTTHGGVGPTVPATQAEEPTEAGTSPAPPTTAGTVTTSAPTTTAAPADPDAIVVPVNAGEAVPVQPIATVEYGPGEEQIEVLNLEFPPPAVWHVGGVLVLEDAPQTGLTGDAVIVQTGPDASFEDGSERRFIPVAIEVAEPNGTPIGVRSLDGGGIVVVTVHDEEPRVRIRRYIENPPGLFSEFGEGADREALGDSELRITSEGATWGGEVVVPPNASNPGASRAAVTSDPASGISSTYRIERPAHDGAPANVWTLSVEVDQEFPPGSSSPLVEPFGDGALALIANSSAQFAQPILLLLASNGDGVAYDLDGWSVADVRPEGALLTRSTPTGLELATLVPPS